MSKEQTPITAEEYLKDFSNLKFNGEVRWNNTDILIIMEQYAQAKVLEALEREFSKLDGIDFSLIGGTEYYETEVKPKYE